MQSFYYHKINFIREWILENKGCPFCKTPIIPEDTNTIPRINNLNDDMINGNPYARGVNNDIQNSNGFGNEKLKSLKSIDNPKVESYQIPSNPYFEKIKLYKGQLKSEIALKKSVIELDLDKNFNEKQYLLNFCSGAVEFGLPCEVVYNRSLEVIIIYLKIF